MSEISLIPRGIIHLKNVGRVKGLWPFVLLLGISVPCFVWGQTGLGFFFFVPFILISIVLFRPLGNYQPTKSFYWYRLQKKDLYQVTLFVSIIFLCFLLWGFYLLIADFTFRKLMSYGAGGLSVTGLFATLFSKLKYHEDVDYSINHELMDLMGFQIDEIIVGSYSNFSLREPSTKKNKNILVITNRQIYFAQYSNKKWYSLKKGYAEINKIGLHGALYVVFKDKTELIFRFSSREDDTISHPALIIRQFLNALDINLSGHTETKVLERRRVILDKTRKSDEKENLMNRRNIELSTALIQELSYAEESIAGRRLEIY